MGYIYNHILFNNEIPTIKVAGYYIKSSLLNNTEKTYSTNGLDLYNNKSSTTIEIYPVLDTGYKWETKTKLLNSTSNEELTPSNDITIANATKNNPAKYTIAKGVSVNVTGNYVEDNTTQQFTINKSYISNATISPDVDSIDSGTAITLTITPNDGYELSGNLRASYVNSSGQLTGVNVTGSGATLTLDAEQTTYSESTAGVELRATITAKQTAKFTFDKSQLSNVTVDPDISSIDSGTAITLTFTAATGYEITGNVRGSYVNASGQLTGQNALGSGNVLSLTSEQTTVSDTIAGMILRASVSEVTPVYITPTYHLTNCTITPEPAQITGGQQYNFTFTANEGYNFESNPYIISTDSSGTTITANAIGSGGTYTLTTTFDLVETSTIDIYATAVSETRPMVNFEYALTDCTITPQPTTANIGDTISLTLSPNSGYYFAAQPTATYTNTLGTTTTIDAVSGVLSFTLNESDIAADTVITVTGTAIVRPKTNNYGTVVLYKITGDTLLDIETFNRSLTVDPVPTLTDNVASVRVFYCPISDTGENIDIKLGLYKTNVQALEIPPDTITINCGEIKIEGSHKNALDYDDEIEFWLPFVGTLNINANRVMDKTIKLQYKVNVFDGACTAILYDGDIAIGYGSGNISFEIPYGVNDNYQISSQLAAEPNYLLDLTPNVTVRSEIALDGINYNDNHKITIGEQNGYCEFTDFILNGFAATQPELNMITQQLQTGIII